VSLGENLNPRGNEIVVSKQASKRGEKKGRGLVRDGCASSTIEVVESMNNFFLWMRDGEKRGFIYRLGGGKLCCWGWVCGLGSA
jgi:hypothetical protein